MTVSHPEALLSGQVVGQRARFYRPELDVLRLFAFLSVFLTHGPRLLDSSVPWRHFGAKAYDRFATGGVYGLSLFFFLSSYLITELLIRERRNTGTVHLRWFYIRRVLRIWPLYYLGIACALTLPFVLHFVPAVSAKQTVFLSLFVGYLAEAANGNPFGVLWSISVEELFYAVWPLLIKFGRNTLFIASLVIIPISLLMASTALDIWYNPLVQFMFFASGALFALKTSEWKWQASGAVRLVLIATGFFIWIVARMLLHRIEPVFLATPTAFVMADVGCVLIFLSFLNAQLRPGLVTQSLLYLGRISYGLYVFHLACYMLVEHWLMPNGIHTSLGRMIATQVACLVLTMGIASLSYRFYELPFLRLKDRYAPVKTRL